MRGYDARYAPAFFAMMRRLFFLLTGAFVFCGCASGGNIHLFPVSPGVVQYYLPSTAWKAKDSTVRLDITYRDEPGSSAICNFSLTVKSGPLPAVSAAAFAGDGTSYPLEDIGVIFFDAAKKTVRLTSKIPQDRLLAMLNAQSLVLEIAAGGVTYRCEPSKGFLDGKTQLADNLAYSRSLPRS